MQKIIPHLWFDKEAKAAAEFHVSVFGQNSKVKHVSTLHNTPSGDADVVIYELWGYEFQAISAGPIFKVNASVSFMVNFDPSQDKDAAVKIDEVWGKLSEGGKIMMPIQKYPFSERYGWIEDKFGVSWQLMLTNPVGDVRPRIIPSTMFVHEVAGKAEEATDFYISVFSARGGSASGGKNSKRGTLSKYPAGSEPDKETSVMFTDFMLEGQWFAAMDSAHQHDFKFTEAISYLVKCESQEEIDYLWKKLSAVPASEQCGWLKDKYGFSWQISSTKLKEYMTLGTPEQVARVTQAFLQMKKFDLVKLKQAYDGK